MCAANIAYEQEVISYFKEKADKYDLVDNQIYWVLSDELLWDLFQEKVLNTLPSNFKFLDAGGGTGRWTLKILESYPQAQGIIFDLSKEMTQEAIKKVEARGHLNRFKVINGNLNFVTESFEKNEFDLIFNFHNVLGFVEQPSHVISSLSKLLKNGRPLVSLVPNKYHSIFFNIQINAIEEAEKIAASGKGRFTSNMPEMNLFTPSLMKEIYENARLQDIFTTGFPNFIYPGKQETDIEGSTHSLERILNDKYDQILKIEKQFLNEQISARGNNIFVVGYKTEEIN